MTNSKQHSDDIEQAFDRLTALTLCLGEVSHLCDLFGNESKSMLERSFKVDLLEYEPVESAAEALGFFKGVADQVKSALSEERKMEGEACPHRRFVKLFFWASIQRETKALEELLHSVPRREESSRDNQ